MSQAEDMDAIDRYMRTTPLKTPEAFQIKDAYIRWFDNLSWYNKNFDGPTYDESRTRRNQLNIANQPTEAAKQEIRNTLTRGIDTEEMQGNKKAAFDPATGRVGTQVKKPTVQPTPSTMPNAQTPVPQDSSAVLPAGLPLVVGSKGPLVDQWQKFLGISPTTGYYGEVTAAKTKNWQNSWNSQHPNDKIGSDGKAGKETWKRAFNITEAAPPGPGGTTPVPLPPSPTPPGPVINPTPHPSPKPSGGSAAKPAVKPATGTKPSAGATAKAKTKKVAQGVVQAGMFDIGKWPVWAKVAGGVTIVGGIVAALMGQKPRDYTTRSGRNNRKFLGSIGMD